MQASENIVSPDVLSALGSNLASRYSHLADNGENSYGGNRYFEDIFNIAQENICKLYGARYAEIRPTGGHIATSTAILSIMSKGDTMLAIGPAGGGYPGYEQAFLPDMFSLLSSEIPYNAESQTIEMEEFGAVISEKRPTAVVLGQSAFVRPYDLKPIAELAEKYGFRIIYDGSHVMGLIAGGRFQPDVLKYCDVLLGSTHKSFFGPQGGIILTNNPELYEQMARNITWRTMDNYHPNRVAALGIAASEMLKHGKEYAEAVARNSHELGKALDDLKVPVRFSPWYSESHQVILGDLDMSYVEFSKKMEANGIVVDRDGRIGTSEISRMGYRDMDTIASLMQQAMTGGNVLNLVNSIVSELSLKFWR